MKEILEEKIIKNPNPRLKKSNKKIRENPQLSPRVLELLRIYRGFVKNAIKYDMQ